MKRGQGGFSDGQGDPVERKHNQEAMLGPSSAPCHPRDLEMSGSLSQLSFPHLKNGQIQCSLFISSGCYGDGQNK